MSAAAPTGGLISPACGVSSTWALGLSRSEAPHPTKATEKAVVQHRLCGHSEGLQHVEGNAESQQQAPTFMVFMVQGRSRIEDYKVGKRCCADGDPTCPEGEATCPWRQSRNETLPPSEANEKAPVLAMEIDKPYAENTCFKESTLLEPNELMRILHYQMLNHEETSSGAKCASKHEFLHRAQMGENDGNSEQSKEGAHFADHELGEYGSEDPHSEQYAQVHIGVHPQNVHCHHDRYSQKYLQHEGSECGDEMHPEKCNNFKDHQRDDSNCVAMNYEQYKGCNPEQYYQGHDDHEQHNGSLSFARNQHGFVNGDYEHMKYADDWFRHYQNSHDIRRFYHVKVPPVKGHHPEQYQRRGDHWHLQLDCQCGKGFLFDVHLQHKQPGDNKQGGVVRTLRPTSIALLPEIFPGQTAVQVGATHRVL